LEEEGAAVVVLPAEENGGGDDDGCAIDDGDDAAAAPAPPPPPAFPFRASCQAFALASCSALINILLFLGGAGPVASTPSTPPAVAAPGLGS
jgi:hypothetical protein